MQHNRRGGREWPACYGRSGNDLPRPIQISLQQRRMARLQRPKRQRIPRPILITLQQRRTARRLQHRCCTEERPACRMSLRTQAGTGCHEGGIILSKKPPEWRQSPPQQRFASDLNFVAAKENGSACSGRSGKNYFLSRSRGHLQHKFSPPVPALKRRRGDRSRKTDCHPLWVQRQSALAIY